MSNDSTYSMGAMRHSSKVFSIKTQTPASRRWLNSALDAMTTKHVVSPSCMACWNSMIHLAFSVSSVSLWLDTSIHALPAG